MLCHARLEIMHREHAELVLFGCGFQGDTRLLRRLLGLYGVQHLLLLLDQRVR